MTKPRVTIPKSQLRARLDQAEAIKREMTKLLRELETRATARPVDKPGAWRHHPSDWPQQHGPKRPT